jgi:RHS repeat-associated protein
VRDALGRVTSVTTKANAAESPVNVATAITYMPFGPVASLLHGNALAATFTWDQDYRLSGLVTAQGGTTIQNLTYGFNLADNVTSITDNLASGRNQTFTLDDLQRLASATGAYGAITYTYDAADNRLTRNLSGGPSETFTYGTTNNRLQSAAVTGQPLRSFTTNSAGDITLDDRGAGNTVTIAIGADGRPETITVAGTGATTVTYKHNAFGERVSRVEGSAITHFHYDQDGRLIAESDGTGALVREYLWLGDKPLGFVVGPAASATLYFVHADHLERVQKITDATQAIVWDGQFTPYGRTHAIAGTVQNPLRFPGQWADPAANYFYNTMRDYDPTLGRYLSSDPIGTEGGRNRFSYAGANPQNLVDPTGERALADRLSPASPYVLLGLVSMHLDVVAHSILNPCEPYTLGRALTSFGLGVFLGAGSRFLPRLLGFGRARPPGGSGPGPGVGPGLGGPGAGAPGSGQGAGVLSRFLTGESGAFAPGALTGGGRAQAALLREFGGMPNAYLPTRLGGRYIDSLAMGVAREAKSGYVSLTPRIARQIAKDAELVRTRSVQAVEWVFYRSPVTGMRGPAPDVRQLLNQHGFRILLR